MSPRALSDRIRAAKLRFYLFRHGFSLGYRLRQQCLEMRPTRNFVTGVLAALLPQRQILFYPLLPTASHVIYKLCGLAGIAMTSDPRARYDVAWHFDSAELAEAWPQALVPPSTGVVNRELRDVRKQTVEAVFEQVFGYPLAIDPTTHVGPAICKSDRNGKHDGVIIECPIARDSVAPDHAYQRLITNQVGPEMFLDLRVPVHAGSRIPLVYKKFRPAANRFKSYVATEVVDPSSVFSPDEIELILRFARTMRIDFGEMDVLRDNADGRIYIVDVNNTPYGPPHHLTSAVEAEVFRRLLASLELLLTELNETPTTASHVHAPAG